MADDRDGIPRETEDELPLNGVVPGKRSEGPDDDGLEPASTTPMEPANAEDYEFDESQDLEGSIDGMAFLTPDPHKAGYTGPQSGIAALKFLQSLPPYLSINYASPLGSPDEQGVPEVSSHTPATINRYIDEYFALYHPAYPILHEGTFRARVSGKLGNVLGHWRAPTNGSHQARWQNHATARGLCYTTLFWPSVPSSAIRARPKMICPSLERHGDI